MGQTYIGQVNTFAFNFAPRGFAQCNGQTMAISQNQALFALIGIQYGGNGSSTYQLPNLQGRVAIHQGQLAGGSNYVIGQSAGTENVTLLTSQMPQHVHSFAGTGTLTAVNTAASVRAPQANGFLARPIDSATDGTAIPEIYVPAGTSGTTAPLAGVNVSGTTGVTGGSQPHSNLQPFLVLNVCIATQGVYPSRN